MIISMLRNLILIALILHASVTAAEVYSWKDADGKTHFSDTPPAGKEPSLKTITLPPSGTSAPGQQPPARERPAPTVRSKAVPDSRSTAAADRLAACEKARSELQSLDDKPRRTAAGKGGKFHALDGEERAEEEAGLQKLIQENCN